MPSDPLLCSRALSLSLVSLVSLSLFRSSFLRSTSIPRLLSGPVIFGCGSSTVTVTDSAAGDAPLELENTPVVSVLLLSLPGARVTPFTLGRDDLDDLDGHELLGCMDFYPEDLEDDDLVSIVTMAAPGYAAGIGMLDRIRTGLLKLDEALPIATKVGGVALGKEIIVGDTVETDDVVAGITIVSKRFVVDAVTAQGFKPLGPSYLVSSGQMNHVHSVQEELPGGDDVSASDPPVDQTPMEALGTLLGTMLPADRHRLKTGLLVGVGASEENEDEDETALLMRRILELDPESGSMVIGEAVRPFQRLQFCMWALFVPSCVWHFTPAVRLCCRRTVDVPVPCFTFPPSLPTDMHAFVTPVLGLTNFGAQVCATGRHLART